MGGSRAVAFCSSESHMFDPVCGEKNITRSIKQRSIFVLGLTTQDLAGATKRPSAHISGQSEG
eukprot:6029101-Amphidinium_carterae.1